MVQFETYTNDSTMNYNNFFAKKICKALYDYFGNDEKTKKNIRNAVKSFRLQNPWTNEGIVDHVADALGVDVNLDAGKLVGLRQHFVNTFTLPDIAVRAIQLLGPKCPPEVKSRHLYRQSAAKK